MGNEEQLATDDEAASTQEPADEPGLADEEWTVRYQRRLNELYRSDRFHEQAVGFWAKFVYEFAVKSVPVGLAVLVGLLARWLGVIGYGYASILSWGCGIAVSITFVGWCMSEGNRSEPPEHSS
ncbi:hypothetical protein Halru_2489 [Halovivax ruber XH-70]|uniref:Uncharacterized protein n=1 Tax=Halovivax ruber (strain DSM 18193 / JCM 13892 / XH-70) TaxID=797302 RepID=L0IFR2_HALRX|nr:hypothetical protein [Halovivax ruber]AGB17071.1 hypothetical protein Halru_2489 [Halovivax ruber XH-70]